MERGEIAPKEQFLLLFTIFYYLVLDFYIKTRIGFSLRDKRLFEITEVEITRVDFTYKSGSYRRCVTDRNTIVLLCYALVIFMY